MPLRDKLAIAFTLFLVIVGPALSFNLVQTAMNADVKAVQVIADSSASDVERREAESEHKYLPWLVTGQVVGLLTMKGLMIGLSLQIIRRHKRRKRAMSR